MSVKGSCHCGATQFEVGEAPTRLIRCTCSFCAKRGALWSYPNFDYSRGLKALRHWNSLIGPSKVGTTARRRNGLVRR